MPLKTFSIGVKNTDSIVTGPCDQTWIFMTLLHACQRDLIMAALTTVS